MHGSRSAELAGIAYLQQWLRNVLSFLKLFMDAVIPRSVYGNSPRRLSHCELWVHALHQERERRRRRQGKRCMPEVSIVIMTSSDLNGSCHHEISKEGTFGAYTYASMKQKALRWVHMSESGFMSYKNWTSAFCRACMRYWRRQKFLPTLRPTQLSYSKEGTSSTSMFRCWWRHHDDHDHGHRILSMSSKPENHPCV